MTTSTVHRLPVVASLIASACIAAVLTGCSDTSDTHATVQPTPTRAASTVPTDPTSTPLPSASASPAPTSSPTASAGSRYRLQDPATWTITGDEVGPVALGGRTAQETDDLPAAYRLETGACPAAPETQFWSNGENPALVVTTGAGNVSGVAVGGYEPDAVRAGSPTTAEGAGIGTSLTELQRLYPRLEYLGTYLEERGGFSLWGIDDHGGHITFQLDGDGKDVGLVWVSPQEKPPYEFCG